ncbi:hypothetical protein B0I08_102230 [Glaciihabitans tibetensis]|uniref:Uncharacterized protein n=1 Tax=Glaciihabitans tibetensis TaxID=1266600 RepID=A0A2T0VH63_9MICO|nr:hypothetical protein [Glaciihabitans tibetensis]PRY69554.1 hypothetical protein B0I08_102230 [Glaciihabitans tibetensis]
MSTDPNLPDRDFPNASLPDLFREADSRATSVLDAQHIIRLSKRRRLPGRIAVGSVVSLAVIGVGVAGVNGLNALSPGTTAISGSAESFESADAPAADSPTSDSDSGSGAAGSPDTDASAGSEVPSAGGFGEQTILGAPANKLNLCGGTVAEVAPSESGLELSVEFPDASVGSASVSGTATLTNTGDDPVSGYASPTPAITLSQDGVVIWHSNGPTIMSIADINLAPGESMVFAASFTPSVCAVEDDLGESFRETLPVASAGQYQVSAALDVSGDLGTELVTGPASTVTLR